ncbi:MAG: hypothetical protein ACYS3S_05180, partial [Planctomycetota bacterium]
CKTIAMKENVAKEGNKLCLNILKRAPFPGELFLLKRYHMVRLVIRMLIEGCITSRLGKCKGDYKLKSFYTPRFNDSQAKA